MAGVDRFIRLPELLENYYPVSKSTLLLQVKAGTFPAPHKLGGKRCTAWKISEIESHFAKIGGVV